MPCLWLDIHPALCDLCRNPFFLAFPFVEVSKGPPEQQVEGEAALRSPPCPLRLPGVPGVLGERGPEGVSQNRTGRGEALGQRRPCEGVTVQCHKT